MIYWLINSTFTVYIISAIKVIKDNITFLYKERC